MEKRRIVFMNSAMYLTSYIALLLIAYLVVHLGNINVLGYHHKKSTVYALIEAKDEKEELKKIVEGYAVAARRGNFKQLGLYITKHFSTWSNFSSLSATKKEAAKSSKRSKQVNENSKKIVIVSLDLRYLTLVEESFLKNVFPTLILERQLVIQNIGNVVSNGKEKKIRVCFNSMDFSPIYRDFYLIKLKNKYWKIFKIEPLDSQQILEEDVCKE
jgi:hypothetical protein